MRVLGRYESAVERDQFSVPVEVVVLCWYL